MPKNSQLKSFLFAIPFALIQITYYLYLFLGVGFNGNGTGLLPQLGHDKNIGTLMIFLSLYSGYFVIGHILILAVVLYKNNIKWLAFVGFFVTLFYPLSAFLSGLFWSMNIYASWITPTILITSLVCQLVVFIGYFAYSNKITKVLF